MNHIFELGKLRAQHKEMTGKLAAETDSMRAGDGHFDLSRLKSVLGVALPEDAPFEDRKNRLSEGFKSLGVVSDQLNLVEEMVAIRVGSKREELAAVQGNSAQGMKRLGIPADVHGQSPEDLVYKALDAHRNAGYKLHTTPAQLDLPMLPGEYMNREEDYRDKTLFQRSAGWLPERFRTGQVVPFAYEPTQLIQVIPQLQTTRTHVDWMEQTQRSSDATGTASKITAEGAAAREGVLAWVERNAEIRKITSSVPITQESMEDAPMVAAMINQDLRMMLMEDTESLVFDGETNFTGFLNAAGVNTDVILKSASNIDRVIAVSKMAATIRATGKSGVSHVAMSPMTWHNLSTIRGNDQFMFSHPAMMVGKRIWGYSVIDSTFLGEADDTWNVLMGGFTQWARLAVRRGVMVEVGTVNTQFTEGKRTLLASHRCILQILRAAAFGRIELYSN